MLEELELCSLEVTEVLDLVLEGRTEDIELSSEWIVEEDGE